MGMEITTYHGSDKAIALIDRPLWVTDEDDIAAEYCDDHITTVEIDTTGFATPDDLDIEVIALEDWIDHADEIIAAGYTGLAIEGDMTPFGTTHASWLICDPTIARIA